MTTYAEFSAITPKPSRGNMTAVVCGSVSEAERYVTEFPKCLHGFATCGTVVVKTGVVAPPSVDGVRGMDASYYAACGRARQATQDSHATRGDEAKAMLRDGGYEWDGDTRFWRKPGYRAQATGYDWAETTVFVYRDDQWVAMHAGPGGYVAPGDQPRV